MTATLVAINKPDVSWSRPEHPLLVGKDILELLSSSMYIDPMAMYREYIQNSADAIDSARVAGVTSDVGKVLVKIDPNARTIIIRDNGIGLKADDFADRLTALGGSKKRGTAARGFRGVGRLAGLAFAQEVIFRSRQEGEKTVHELRWSARDVRSMLRSTETKDLKDIVGNSVEVREVERHDWPARFFEVELNGVVRHRDDRLLNREAVFNYLAQVAPVPFHPEFQFAEQITSLLHSHGVRTSTINIEIDGIGRVFRPHRNSTAIGKVGETRFHELTTICTPGRDGDTSAVSWVLHSDYKGALPSASLVDGWRFRVGDIQVGDNDLLMPLFPESRFNAWCVAETHVIDPRILPNGRRDHFEQNAFFLDLTNHLAPHTRDIAQRCRASSIQRNLQRKIDVGLTDCERKLKVLARSGLGESSASRAAVQLVRDMEQIEQWIKRASISNDRQDKYQKVIKKLRKRLAHVQDRSGTSSALNTFTSGQRSLLIEVFHSIHESQSDIEKSQEMVDRILKRLARTFKRGPKRRNY
ncbi:MAG: ATP-binding protein [Acidobacteriaceae bacterium]|nr:ATP-binding protein [Acidobacteriaceae bacterium]